MAAHEIVGKGIRNILERRRVFPSLTVRENLEMGAYLRQDREGKKREWGEIFEHFPILKERQRQEAGTLSGGQQQILAFARALMAKPQVLLADEPSLGLSPIMVREVARILSDINQKGVSIVLVEQNTVMALSLANRAYILQTGKIVMSGDAKEMRSSEEVRKSYLGG